MCISVVQGRLALIALVTMLRFFGRSLAGLDRLYPDRVGCGSCHPDGDERIAALQALLAERDAALADARAQLHSRDLLIGTLRAQLARLRHMQFGYSSEKLSRQIEQLELTLAGWVCQAAALLDPIVSRIRDEGLKAGKLHADDTPVPVLDPGRGKTAQGRLWVYAVDDRGCASTNPPLIWYRFTADRSGLHPQRELARFSGHLQADAYAGYRKLFGTGRITGVACWAHFRRGIVDEHRTQPTALTTDLLDRIGQLYAVEAGIRGKPPNNRAQAQQDTSRPVVDALRGVIDDALRRLLPRSEMAKALRYGVKLWPALTRFLDNSRLEIDDGVSERALRGVAAGRRNWLFAGSIKGGERAAAL